MRHTTFILLAILLLTIQSAWSTLIDIHPFVPDLLLPLVIYVGVQQDISLPRAALVAFVIGVIHDEMSGSPIGLGILLLVITCVIAHGSGVRLFMRGAAFQAGLGFAVAALSGAVVFALRAILENPPPPFPLTMSTEGWLANAVSEVVRFTRGGGTDPLVGSQVTTVFTILASALMTAIASPFVFQLVRRADSMVSRNRRSTDEAPQ